MRYYTLEEANETVPWLHATFEKISSLSRLGVEEQRRLLELLRHGKRNGQSSSEQDVQRKQDQVKKLAKDVDRLLKQIADRAIQVREVERGLVDFPSMREGRTVYLCWVWGESEIGYWHELDSGFAGRKPI